MSFPRYRSYKDSGVERVRILLEFLGRENAVEVPLSKILTEHTPRSVVAASR